MYYSYLDYPYLSAIDLIIAPLFLVLIFFIEWKKYKKKRAILPHYQYYLSGLFAKLFAGIGVSLVYVLYYHLGDTTNYFFDGVCMVNFFLKDPIAAIGATFGGISHVAGVAFDNYTGWPIYSFDQSAFFVDRLTWILCFISCKSYLGETILIAWISYYGIWKLFETLTEEFPALQKQFAIAVLFVPSVVFWGSGLLKDTITFAAVGLFTSGFYGLVAKRRKIIKNVLLIAIGTFLMLRIKPYILFALLPGSLLWIAGITLSNISNKVFRSLISPLFVIISLSSGFLVIKSIGDSLGSYSLNTVFEKALVTQQDLKREEYGGSSFDIGDFEPTLTGVLKKAPAAINATLFRPYVWEARNPFVFLSGLENLGMMVFTIYLILRLKIYNLFRLMFRHHLLAFTVCFSLFFAFSIGLSTSNFGALVRYKIPAIPFYLASLFIIRYTYVELKQKDNEQSLVLEEGASKKN